MVEGFGISLNDQKWGQSVILKAVPRGGARETKLTALILGLQFFAWSEDTGSEAGQASKKGWSRGGCGVRGNEDVFDLRRTVIRLTLPGGEPVVG